MKKYDAVILGGGVAGLGTALHLAKAGRKVVILTRPPGMGEASPAAAGILDPLLEMGARTPFLDLCLEAFKGFGTLIGELRRRGGNDGGYQKLGMYYIAMNRAEEAELVKRLKWQSKSGFPVEWKSRSEILKAEPCASAEARGGLFYPKVTRVFPQDFLGALRRYAVSSGVEIRESTAEPRLETDKGRVRGLAAGDLRIKTGTIVNAMGSWAGLSSFAGVRVPVVPVRGQILLSKPESGFGVRAILHTLNGAYLVPWKKNRFLMGSTVEFSGFRPHPTRAGLKSIRRRISKLVPDSVKLREETSWAGLRPYAKDRLPLIGATRLDGLFLAAGFFRSGILIGVHAGGLLARMILSGRMPRALSAFSPGRF